jgi:hypothetical protein
MKNKLLLAVQFIHKVDTTAIELLQKQRLFAKKKTRNIYFITLATWWKVKISLSSVVKGKYLRGFSLSLSLSTIGLTNWQTERVFKGLVSCESVDLFYRYSKRSL